MPTREELEALIAPLRTIARDAGKAVLDVYARDFDVELKDDRSPLTEADRAAHRVIVAGLSQLTPSVPVLSEEAADSPAERLGWTLFWLVDPLDGTKEFVKRNGEFTVNIALIDAHQPVLGAVLAPALGREYYGGKGIGAWRADNGNAPRPIRVAAAPPPRLRIVGSRSHASGGELARYLEQIGEHELKPMGSSLKICLVAEGEADAYPRFGPTSEWDTAAAHAVLDGAGGCMMGLDGQPLQYNRKESVLNPYFLAVGSQSRDWLAPLRSESWEA